MEESLEMKENAKPDLKSLRQERSEFIEAAKARLKIQGREIGLIKDALREGALTVPGIADKTGLEARKVLFYVSSLMKYGDVREEEQDGRYFRYGLVPGKEPKKKAQIEGC